MTTEAKEDAACICPYTDPSTWLSAASCGYGSGYEPGSMQEWNPECPVHPPWGGDGSFITSAEYAANDDSSTPAPSNAEEAS